VKPLEGWESRTEPVDVLDGVHVWGTQMSDLAALLPSLYELLPAAERKEVEDLGSKQKQRTHILSRSLARSVLAGYVGLRPQELAFETSSSGRPFLSGEHRTDLDFNLAHSGDIVLIAVGLKNRVGVDIEQIREDIDHSKLAHRFFSATENRELDELGQSDARAGFFACWTKKEAIMKAVGEGLTIGIDSFTVSIESGRQHISLKGSCWTVTDLAMRSGYVGALAMVDDRPVRRFIWRASGR
jgi:4'-phosphopantetheinyl transferase